MVKQKIAFFTLSLRRGGAERVISNLCNELVDSHEVFLILIENQIDYKIDERIKVILLNPSGDTKNGFLKLISIPLNAIKLNKVLKTNNIKLLFSYLFRPNISSVLVKKFSRQVKVVISERSNPWLQYDGDNMMSRINRYLLKTFYPIADKITVNSYGSKIALEKHYDIDSDKIGIIRNPLNDSFFRDNKSKANNKFTYITVGRLDEGKNHRLLVDAFKILVDYNISEFEFWIIGTGPLETDLKKRVNELGLDSHVKFLGYISNVESYLNKSDVFVFSSNREGFPNVILEAMAVGLPVISTDCCFGPREIIVDKNEIPDDSLSNVFIAPNGILVPLNDPKLMANALSNIFENYLLMNQLIENYDVILEKYKLPIIIKQYKKMIDDIRIS